MKSLVVIAFVSVLGICMPVSASDEIWTLDDWDSWMGCPGSGRTFVPHGYPKGTPVKKLEEKGLLFIVLYREIKPDQRIVICATREQHRKIVKYLLEAGYRSPLVKKASGG